MGSWELLITGRGITHWRLAWGCSIQLWREAGRWVASVGPALRHERELLRPRADLREQRRAALRRAWELARAGRSTWPTRRRTRR